jgi:diaminohydroxyphosphoribosylaminopyrimidine deaminase/5-amino-6-(5-phosphoribosylamino)uracil reductase
VAVDGRRASVDLRALLAALGEIEVMSVLVEGGGTLLGSLFDERLVDKVFAYVAPKVFGGDSTSPVGGRGVDRPISAVSLAAVRFEKVGDDILAVGYPVYQPAPSALGESSDQTMAAGREACLPG